VNAIICLQEVSGTWEKRFREYFESRGWTFLIAKRNRVDQDNMGNAIAFKKDYFVIKRIQYGFPMFDSSIITKTDYPFDIERIKMSNEEAISNTNSVTDTTCGELTGNCDNESVVANNHADFNVRINTDQIVQDLKDSDNDECGVASDTVDSIISLAFDSDIFDGRRSSSSCSIFFMMRGKRTFSSNTFRTKKFMLGSFSTTLIGIGLPFLYFDTREFNFPS